MKVSVIVPTYKDLEALKLIIEALENQIYKDFELIIAEDDNSNDVEAFVKNYNGSLAIKHFSQEDKGWRKARALNGAIKLSSGEYLIFFDGDCLPYSTFVHAHVELAQKNKVLCGRRVNSGDGISLKLRKKVLNVNQIENNFLSFWKSFKEDGARHIEQGIYLLKYKFLYKKIIKFLDKRIRLVGCNFSLYRDSILAINGFDESYPSGDVADDVDIEWRLNALGIENKSCRYAANLLHLNHERKDRREAHQRNMNLMKAKQQRNEYKTKTGLN